MNDNIVATYGWRKDKAESWRDDSPDYTSEAIALPETLGFGPVPDNSTTGDVFTWGVVGHLPEEWSPAGIGLSAHYGVSENFVPSPGRITILNEMHPDPAEKRQVWFLHSLPEQNFYVRFNWFDTVSSIRRIIQWAMEVSLTTAPLVQWCTLAAGKTPQVLPSHQVYETWDARTEIVAEQYRLGNALHSTTPWYKKSIGLLAGPGAGTAVSVSDKRNPNMVGVSDFSSEGMEVEELESDGELDMMFNVANKKLQKRMF